MMTIKQIFNLGLQMGIKADPRGPNGIKDYLAGIKKEYDNLKPKDKEYFNSEFLTNPFADSRIHVGNEDAEVRRILTGIDINDGEILLASQLGERKKTIDLVLAHHPIGRSLANLHGVMDMQVEMLVQAGLPVHSAEKIMEERIKEVGRSIHSVNHYKIIDLARLLNVNLMNTHTISDNLVSDFLQKHILKRKPLILGDLIDALLEIPEYREAKSRGAGPNIFLGDARHKVGKYILEMTGGTNPSEKVYQELSGHGISTVIGMHMRDGSRDKASEHNMNVVIAGHMASDSLGMNLFLDELEKRGVDIVPCGGLIRISRVKSKNTQKKKGKKN